MVVGPEGEPVARHDREVIFGVVGVGVLALAPLDKRPVIAHAHDRRPVAVARVVGVAAANAVVIQAHRVTRFMRSGLGNVFLDIRAKIVAETRSKGCRYSS